MAELRQISASDLTVPKNVLTWWLQQHKRIDIFQINFSEDCFYSFSDMMLMSG